MAPPSPDGCRYNATASVPHGGHYTTPDLVRNMTRLVKYSALVLLSNRTVLLRISLRMSYVNMKTASPEERHSLAHFIAIQRDFYRSTMQNFNNLQSYMCDFYVFVIYY